tara:strand:+ start:392 stop:772 length:381 start_codon:yes stop_codon:yes gene_type:complete
MTGCAGSPLHTKSLSPSELRVVDNYTLCKGATPREFYEPSREIIFEVQRRGVNCSEYYTYDGMDLDGVAKALQGMQNEKTNTHGTGPAVFKYEYISGHNKICIYDRTGSAEAYNFKATDICPLTLP